MRYNFGTEILNASGEKVGELHQVVIDPVTDQVTSLIAKKGFLLPSDKVIPISLVMDSTEEHIKLYDFEGSYDDLDDYVEIQFVPAEEGRKNQMVDDDDERPLLLPYPPAGSIPFGFSPVINYPDRLQTKRVKNIPEKTIEIPEGAKVLGMNGEHVGNVEEVITNPRSDRVTHFIMSKGIFFNEEKMIPSGWVSGYDSNQLKLVVDSKIVEQLPEYK